MYYYLSNPIKEVYCHNHKEKKVVCYFKNIFFNFYVMIVINFIIQLMKKKKKKKI